MLINLDLAHTGSGIVNGAGNGIGDSGSNYRQVCRVHVSTMTLLKHESVLFTQQPRGK